MTRYVEKPYLNVNLIHPLQQRVVEEFINGCKDKYPSLKRIIIFGSSVTDACNSYSDLDVYLEGIKRSDRFVPPEGERLVDYDIWYEDDYQDCEQLFKEIRDKGVVVFERD